MIYSATFLRLEANLQKVLILCDQLYVVRLIEIV